MFLWIFDTQLCAQGMEQIRQFMHIFIPLLPQRSPLYVLVLITPHGIILFLDGLLEKIPSGYIQEQRVCPLIPFHIVGFPLVLDMGGGFQ